MGPIKNLITILIYVLLIAINLLLIRQTILEKHFDGLDDFIIAIIMMFIPGLNIILLLILINHLNTINDLKELTPKEFNDRLAKLLKIKKK